VKLKLQIIFRLYNGISEILHGFDLGPSAVAFTGEEVYLTSLGKFCYENGIIIVDTTRRSTTYESRLKKYMQRGFSIVLPNLDISKLSVHNLKYGIPEVAELAKFAFAYDKILGNRIHLKKLLGKFVRSSDYDGEQAGDKNSTTARNVMTLLRDNWNECWYYYTSYDIGTDILHKGPDMNIGEIDQIYHQMKSDLIRDGKFDYSLYRKFIRHKPLIETLCEYFAEGPDSPDRPNVERRTFKERQQYVFGVIDTQATICKKRCEEILARGPQKVEWTTENAGTQLTGSFNPIIENAVEWYGARYFIDYAKT